MEESLVPLTSSELDLIHYIEVYYMRDGEFPPVDNLCSRFNLEEDDIQTALDKNSFRLALKNRGISSIPKKIYSQQIVIDDKTVELSPEQISAVRLILDFRDKRSQGAKLRSLGLTSQQWQGWLRNTKFKNYLHKLSSENFKDSLEVAHEGLLKQAERGDVGAIKFYMELTGRYSTESNTVANLQLAIAKLVESVQRHIKDPETIRAIAQDFDVIMSGGNTVPVDSVGNLKELI